MYTLAVQRSFDATHHLIGGDWGKENEPHTHSYRLELLLQGTELNKHGYLVDLVELENKLDNLLDEYRRKDLNTLADFAGLNPSLEHFARILCTRFTQMLNGIQLTGVSIKLWESETAWASYRLEP
ncbi:MAG: 6-pyruvoyl trahydropterin synthase family protein [Anaerolineales bacterium]